MFQAISIMTRPGLSKFPMWLYSGCLCYIFPSCIQLHSMQSIWLCYMKYFCINPFYKCNIAKYVCAYSSFIFVQIYTCSECPNIHLQWMYKIYIRALLCFSLYLEYNLCPRLIHQWKCWNGLTFLFVFVLESAFLEVLQFAHFYAKGVVLRNNHWLIDGLRHHFKSACNTILGVRAISL